MGLLAPARLSAEEAERTIAARLAWILEACEPMAVILFGSAARGELTEASDLDLVLVFRDERELKASRKAIFTRPPPDQRAVDLVLVTRDEFIRRRDRGGLYELVAAEGRVLRGGLE